MILEHVNVVLQCTWQPEGMPGRMHRSVLSANSTAARIQVKLFQVLKYWCSHQTGAKDPQGTISYPMVNISPD